MDIFKKSVDYLSKLDVVKDWPELRENFEKMAQREPHGWSLPNIAAQAVGGRSEQAIPAVVAIGCLQMAIILIDDMLDEDPRGKHHEIGHPAAANLASAFQAAGLQAITASDTEPKIILAAHDDLNQMIVNTSHGQNLDIINPADEEAYWEMVQTKSSPFYSSALYVGALFGGAAMEIAREIKQFGSLYGEMIQIHDDMKDSMETPANPDWLQGRYPLPLLFAHVVDHPERKRFRELRKDIINESSLEEAQEILVRCGAISYCLDQLLMRYEKGKMKLSTIHLKNTAGLEGLLDEVVQPVRELLSGINAPMPEILMT